MKSQVEIIGGDENILHVFETKLDCANKTVQSEVYVSIESEETVDLKVKLVSQGSVISEETNPAGIQLKTISESGMYSIQFELQCVQKCWFDYLNLVILGDFQNNFQQKIEIFKIALPARLSARFVNALYHLIKFQSA